MEQPNALEFYLEAVAAMDPIREAIRQQLGHDIGDHELTLYSLLGVSSDAPVNEIKKQFSILAKRWNESDRQSNPAMAKKVGALLKDAQRILLDEKEWANYDRQLAKLATQLTGKEQSHPDFLPPGDPTTPFDEAAFVRQLASQSYTEHRSIVDRNSADERYSQLLSAVKSESDSYFGINHEILDHSTEGFSSDLDDKTVDLSKEHLAAFQQSSTLDSVHDTREDFLGAPAQRTLPSTFNSHRGQPQRKAISLGIIALGATLIAGIGIYALYAGSKQPTLKTASLPNATLPPLPSDDAKKLPEEESVPETTPETEGFDNAEEINAASIPAPVMNMNSDGENTPEGTPPTTEPNDAPNDAPKIDITTLEPKLREARAKLEQSKFDEIAALLTSIPAETGNAEFDAKHARLAQLGKLFQTATAAFEKKRSELPPGSTLKIGNREIKVVSVTPSVISLQLIGGVKEYSWEQLPMGVTTAILESAIPADTPENAAAQAAFLKFHKLSPTLAQPQISRLLDQAKGAGSLREDLEQAFTDTYP